MKEQQAADFKFFRVAYIWKQHFLSFGGLYVLTHFIEEELTTLWSFIGTLYCIKQRSERSAGP
ncbi:MAG: hypothetical protein C6W54_05855 [Bacillaceae bacterium]|nr:MAG: hypothetical protein C6W54_05855 [Bacillaceae bacterium]